MGVHLPLLKSNKALDYEIAFGGLARLSVNPVERMVAEKLATFAIYGTDNTRDKDLFDAYWLITRVQHDKALVYKMLESLLVRRTHFFKTLDTALQEAVDTLRDKAYVRALGRSRKNWTDENIETILNTVIDYLGG